MSLDTESPGFASPTVPPREDRARLLLLVLACLVLVFHVAVFAGWIIDDAYVSFRYAHNLVHGRGLVFNPGERIEGYTNFSWTMLSAGAIALGLEPDVVMPVIGFASGIALVLLVAREGRRLAEAEGRPHALAGLPAAFIMACSTGMALYAVSGLEMTLFALIQTAAVVAVVSGRGRRFALLAAFGFLTRPEAGLVGILGLALLAARALRDRRSGRSLVEAIAILLALVGPYLIFKWLWFGSLLPNTFTAKPADLTAGVLYVAKGVLPLAGFVIAAAVSTWKAGAALRRQEPSSRWPMTGLLLGTWCAMTLGVVLVGGDFMWGERMLLPGMGLLALAADRTMLELGVLPRRLAVVPRVALLVAVLGYPIMMARETWFLSQQGSLYAGVDVGRRKFASKLVEKGIGSLATYDVGLLGYLAPGIRVIDLGGLTDRTIARAPGYYWSKEPPERYLQDLSPEAFVFTSLFPPRVEPRTGQVQIPSHYLPEDLVKGMPWFARSYIYVGTAEVLKGEYFLHLFVRRDLPAT